MNAYEDIAPQSRQLIVCMVGGGHKLVPHRITFPGNFTTFKALFSVGRRFFPDWSIGVKSWKNRGVAYCY